MYRMSDINVQTFQGKVNISNNLKVGSGHLFVDTLNNQVGLNTNTPLANLHVNGNTYVNTDLRVGSKLLIDSGASDSNVLVVTGGNIKADYLHGDGSNIQNITSSQWTTVNTNELYYDVGNVGIGTTTAAYTLDVDGDINFTGDLYENGSLFVNTSWNIETSPDALNYTAGNVGIGGVNPSATLEVTGNTHISSNLSVGGTLTLNTITAAALHSLQAVTDVGNVTSNTVQFTNTNTGLVVDSNIVVAGNVTAAFLYGDASNVTAVPAAQITGTLAVANGGTGTTTSTGTGSVVLSDAPTF